MSITPPSAVLVEATDGPCQARFPSVTLWHSLSNGIHALRVCESLVVDNLTGFRDAENSNLGTFEGVVLGADGGVAADVADDAAAYLPRPRLSCRGNRKEDGEGEAQLEKERAPAREGRGHG